MTSRTERYTDRASLAQLLLGTSVAAIGWFLPAAAAAQSAQKPGVENIVVTGLFTAPDLTKLPEPVLDTPITIDTITSQQMRDRGDISLNDVFRNVPSITLEAGEMSWQGNAPYLRGFSARTDMFLDGMRDIGDYNRDPWNLENVQVLEGPDSFLFGRGSAGGMIEQDAKRPRLDAFTQASVSGGTNDLGRATADINVPFDDLGLPAAFRLSLMGDSNDQAGRDVVKSKRYGLAPSLALGLGLPTRLDVSYFHQTENDIPDYGLPWYFGAPPPVNTSNYYGYRSDHLNSTADIATVRGEHDFSDGMTLSDQFRYGNYSRSITGSKPALPASATPATPPGAITVNINSVSVNSTEQQVMNQTDLSARFDTGPVHHDLVAGLEYDWESSTPQVFNSSGLTNSLLNPNENMVFNPAATFPRVSVDTTTNTESVYAADTMKLGEQWQFALGVRFDRFSAHFNEQVFSVPPAATGVLTGTNAENHVDEMPSWHGSLIYKPVENGTIFLTYATSYDPSAETLDVIQSFTTFSIANENLDPEKNRSMELGTKWSLMDDHVNLSGSLFQTRKYNARIPDPSIPGFNMLA